MTNFNTGNALDMSSMFESCVNLKSLDLSSFVTNKCKDFTNIFKNDNGLVIIIDENNNQKLIENLPDYVNYTNTIY